MNWKELLLFDLGRLRPGYTPADAPPEPFRWFQKGSKPDNTRPYRVCAYYRFLTNRRWCGPRFLRTNPWRRDLLFITNQLTAMARTNAPFHTGLELLAHEEQGEYRSKPSNLHLLYAVLIAAAILGLLLFAGAEYDVFMRLDWDAFLYALGSCCAALIPVPLLLSLGGAREALLLRMRDRLEEGHTLSETMRHFSNFFPRFYADLTEAGETSGQLAATLAQLGEETLRSVTLRQTLRPVILYVAGVASLQIGLLAFLAVKVMPVFSEILREVGVTEPTPLRWFTQDIPAHLPLLCDIAVVAVLLTAFILWVTRDLHALLARPLSALFLAVPGLRSMVVHQNLVVAGTILSKLLTAGVPLDQALDKTANANLHPLYRRCFKEARTKVLQGESFSNALEIAPRILIPRLFVGWTALGERSGMLPQALERLGDFYRRDVDKRLRIAGDLVLPVGVAALGFLSLAGTLAMFTAITSIGDALILY